jgi:Xaa-Pro dipeptidase
VTERQLPFPRSEFERRLAQVDRALSNQRLDAALITGPENLYYLTGNPITGPMALLLRRGGPPLLLADEYDEYNVQTYSWIDQVRFHAVGQSWLDLVPAALGPGVDRVGIDVKSSALSVSTYLRLRAQLPSGVDLVDTLAVEEARLIKSAAELECVRAAARIATTAMRAGLAAIAVGRTENDVAAEIYRVAIAEGSEHLASQPYVKAGSRAWVTHGRWQETTIRGGDTVFIELAGCVKRYHGALMRSAVCGKPTHRIRAVAEAVLASVEATFDALRSGVPAREVSRASWRWPPQRMGRSRSK